MLGKLCCYTLTGLGLLFSLAPLMIYGFANTGTVVIFLSSCLLFFCVRFWARLPPALHWGIVGTAILGLGFALYLSARMACHAWIKRPPADGADIVIVLGAKAVDDQPSLMLRQRLSVALDYLERHPHAICIVSGGRGPDETLEEAEVMARYLIAGGIEESRIHREMRSTNTLENMAYSLEIANGLWRDQVPPSVVVVTQSFHQLRASLYAGAAGYENCYALSAATPWGLFPSYWVREWPALCKAWLVDL